METVAVLGLVMGFLFNVAHAQVLVNASGIGEGSKQLFPQTPAVMAHKKAREEPELDALSFGTVTHEKDGRVDLRQTGLHASTTESESRSETVPEAALQPESKATETNLLQALPKIFTPDNIWEMGKETGKVTLGLVIFSAILHWVFLVVSFIAARLPLLLYGFTVGNVLAKFVLGLLQVATQESDAAWRRGEAETRY